MSKQLPINPNLTQLKKQAKNLLKAYKQGKPDAIRRIRQFHPQFQDISDSGIKNSKFQLTKAQLVIAREYGFSSWPKLKSHLDQSLVKGASSVDKFPDLGKLNQITNGLVNHLLIWHCTLSENAESISREGFIPGKGQKSRKRRKTLHFFHSAVPFLSMVTAVDQSQRDGFFCAVEPERYTYGLDYVHTMTDVFVFHVPLPRDMIVARFSIEGINSVEDLKRVLSEQLQCDISKAFSDICTNEAIPWNQLTGIAGTLRELDENSYHNAELTKRLIRAEIEGIDEQEYKYIFSLFAQSNQWFQQMFLDLYYGKYAFPHFARALMVAGARFVHPIQVLAFYAPTVVIPDGSKPRKRPDNASVAALLAEVLPRLSREKVVFGAIEMAAMRKYSGNEADLRVIENWLAQQGSVVEEVAFHFIRFGHHSAVIRQGGTAVRMAVAILKGTGKGYFERLLSLADTDYPPHSTLIQAFSLLKEKRAIPYLESKLKDERKQVRAAVVAALGQIGTDEAIELVKQAANDKTTVVQRAVRAALRPGQ